MTRPSIDLITMPADVMLLIECPSGVVYRSQAGGTLCWQVELEGVLAGVDFSDESVEQILRHPFPYGMGIDADIADMLDTILAAKLSTRYLKVNRARLDESLEAWVYVHAETGAYPPGGLVGPDYFGSVFDFGTANGVLTWHNSD